MEESRIEQLVNAFENGGIPNFNPQSRVEERLYSMLKEYKNANDRLSKLEWDVVNHDETILALNLEDKKEHRFSNEVESITISFSSVDDMEAYVAFTSGATPTEVVYDDNIKWSGCDTIDGDFVPVENRRYNIGFWYDGMLNAIVRGVDA